MSIYSDKLAHCQYSVVQLFTCEDKLAQYLGAPYLDDMSHNELITEMNNKFVFKLKPLPDN